MRIMTLVEMRRWAWNPDRNANETFEDIGEWFCQETRYLRPGKSYPRGYAPPEEEQRKAWEEWRTQKAREFIAGLECLDQTEYIASLQLECGALKDALLEAKGDKFVVGLLASLKKFPELDRQRKEDSADDCESPTQPVR